MGTRHIRNTVGHSGKLAALAVVLGAAAGVVWTVPAMA
jgi:hypothetical protein